MFSRGPILLRAKISMLLTVSQLVTSALSHTRGQSGGGRLEGVKEQSGVQSWLFIKRLAWPEQFDINQLLCVIFSPLSPHLRSWT